MLWLYTDKGISCFLLLAVWFNDSFSRARVVVADVLFNDDFCRVGPGVIARRALFVIDATDDPLPGPGVIDRFWKISRYDFSLLESAPRTVVFCPCARAIILDLRGVGGLAALCFSSSLGTEIVSSLCGNDIFRDIFGVIGRGIKEGVARPVGVCDRGICLLTEVSFFGVCNKRSLLSVSDNEVFEF